MKKIRFSTFLIMAALSAGMLMTSCSADKFRVSGTISNAEDNILYFENASLNGPVVVDSVTLKADGQFDFTDKAPKAPEFYRLRIGGQIINLVVDSTEHIGITASLPTMATAYEVTGSDDCLDIKDLALKQMALQQQINQAIANPKLSFQQEIDVIDTLVEAYKNDVRQQIIYKIPMKPVAYFALFQTISYSGIQQLLFNPRSSEDDVKAFAAVATSWDIHHPKAERGENLHNIAIEGMKNIRLIKANESKVIDESVLNLSNVIEIALEDNKGKLRRLTELQGKVVLLDFHLFAANESTERIMALRDIYNKYHDRGLEIYQVSLDPDKHFWKTQTAALPWICVYGGDGNNNDVIISYNVQAVPTYFLLDKNCVPHKRDVQIQDLDAEIKSLL